MTPSPPRSPFVYLLAAAALVGFLVAGVMCIASTGCAPLTLEQQTQLRAAEPAILAADELACDESAMIPVVGAAIAAVACPLEVKAVKDAIDRAVAPAAAPDAGAPSAMLARVYRATRGGGRKVIGKVAAPAAGAVQFHLFVMPPSPPAATDAGPG